MINRVDIDGLCKNYNLSCKFFEETNTILVTNKMNQEYWRLKLKTNKGNIINVIMLHENSRGNIGGFHLQGQYPSLEVAIKYIYLHLDRKVATRCRKMDRINELLNQIANKQNVPAA